MCDSTYTQDPAMNAALAPYGDTDSCDEYPFAATYENPANSGAIKSGSECAQVTAVQIANPTGNNEAADWPTVTPLQTPTKAELCARGHIPLNLNKSVGGSLGNFVQGSGQRLIDHDPFWVTVTS
jgi:hypothetical protein